MKNMWEEYIIWSLDNREGIDRITLCGLCGNCGMLDTRESAIHNNKKIGVLAFCICPNGQAMKRSSRAIVITVADGGIFNKEKVK